MMGSFVGRGNQYIQWGKVLYCKLPTIGKQLPALPHKVWGLNQRPQRWEPSVLSLHHRGPGEWDAISTFIAPNLCYIANPDGQEEGKGKKIGQNTDIAGLTRDEMEKKKPSITCHLVSAHVNRENR